MPPPKKATKASFALRLESAAGASIRDFRVLGYSSDYDTAFEHTKTPTVDFPTTRFTHVLHYVNGVRTGAERVDDRLLRLLRSPSGEWLAAGFPRGVYHLDPGNIGVTLFQDHAGVFTGLWSSSPDHVFACGMIPAFTLHRGYGQWQALALPTLPGEVLQDLCGFSERDVYCVGERGIIMHFDGRAWTLLEVPTTRGLRCVAPLGQHVCAAGEDGIFLYGDRHGFRVVPSGTREIIQGLAPFQDALYFGCSDGVYRFDGRSLPSLALAQPAARVSGLHDGLLIQNGTEAFTWDGQTLVALDTVL